MPVAHFHIPVGSASTEQRAALLTAASAAYSRILDSPIERVRAFVVQYDPTDLAVGGQLVADGGSAAPYFTAIVLAGRPPQQRSELLAAFTDLVVEHLDVERSGVRGQIVEVAPENWGIAGVPASDVRASEIALRAAR
ncbi:tautomerase family protein [Gordonia hongkongensis]|uniref:Tautomerase family protein n=1 Tax=Gordonia hongkongensis TaxID=1701090 RepID=A0AAX3T6E6_9ACTN|nr:MULTISPECIES: tautomerase family protein [Gordonia]MCZ4536445.1 tautomerase family protein [Gordonia terrae]KSU61188.1 4-oxalocrotonate tautomerase [Gordonia sp. SGD-V-85]MDT0221003.1 tautomerase family protein [Gordonia sp. AC31]QIK46558.1 4-oxalocrotonate tautomerase [Gordonia terrae]WFP24443.1 tautomerase family protein [Gordonia hongkongensis]